VSRIAYFDCASGASGDMLLGALVDLGLPLDSLRAELAKLPVRGYTLEAHRVHRSGLHATKVDVVVEEGEGGGPRGGHEGHHRGHPHRGLRDILGLLEASALPPAVKERSAALFRRLADAEAAVHGASPDEVHFHEVGAVDSIVDIVGGVVGLAWLGAERFAASPLNVGTGTVTMSHGTFSVPPPATARLVQGAPIYGAGPGELLTPTGALLVTSYATSYGPLPPLMLEATGHGAGSRDIPGHPNVLRVLVGEESSTQDGERVLVLECEIDDMSPQLFPPLVDALLRAGAHDAYLTPVQMKKGRPGMLVTVVAPPERQGEVEERLFSETTTLGVRRSEWSRTVLERETVTVDTAYGPVAVKIGRRGERIYNVQPEFDDCQQRAAAVGAPVKEVWAAALAAWRSARPKGS
jgi:uncharacterized protein (TIGR00299 family) protein